MANASPSQLDTSNWEPIGGVDARDFSPQESVVSSPTRSRTSLDSEGGQDGLGSRTFPSTDGQTATQPEKPPVPRKGSRRGKVLRQRSVLEEIGAEKSRKAGAKSRESEGLQTNPATSVPASSSSDEPPSRRRSWREPLRTLNTEVDEAAADKQREGNGSPINGALGKSVWDQDAPLEYPDNVASPIEMPSSSLARPILAPRNQRNQGNDGSARGASRRSTARSTSSSRSIAGPFLSQYRRDSQEARPPQADEEGQEIGEHSKYIIGRTIGKGAFSVVKEAHTVVDGISCVRAVKIVRKQGPGAGVNEAQRGRTEFDHEVSIWRKLKHDHILPLISDIDTEFATFCIIPLTSGGSLFDLVRHYRRHGSTASSKASVKQHNAIASETGVSTLRTSYRAIPLPMAKIYLDHLARALSYLHNHAGIVHRDVKPENCLISTNGSTSPARSNSSTSSSSLSSTKPAPESLPTETNPGTLLLCDFGMSDYISATRRLPHYLHGIVPSADTTSLASPNTGIGPGPNSAAFRSRASSSPTNAHRNDSYDETTHGTVSEAEAHPASTATEIVIAGSLPYASPELIRAGKPLYEPSADIWAYGVTAYALFTGQLPFRDQRDERVVQLIKQGEWDREAIGRGVRGGSSQDVDEDVRAAEELVGGCLEMDVGTRWDVERILGCDLLRDENGVGGGQNGV